MQKNGDADLLKIKGVALFFLGRFAEAVDVLYKAANRKNDSADVLYFLSMARFFVKGFVGATTDLERTRKLGAKIDVRYEQLLANSASISLNRQFCI